MFKALFFDIDGTLVSFTTHSVPESTRQAIHEARLRGIKVFICTGRPLQFINNLQGVEYDGMVCATGALCLDSEGNTIFQRSIAKEDVKRLLTFLPTNPIPFLAIAKEHVYGFNTQQDVVSNVMTTLNVQLPTLLPIEGAANDDILQLIGFFSTDEETHIMNTILPHSVAARWHPSFSDVISQGVGKDSGIDNIIRHYGIDISETIGIGDGGNDIPMLCHAALGIAMGNASDKVKAHADYITTHVDDNGILHALQHFHII